MLDSRKPLLISSRVVRMQSRRERPDPDPGDDLHAQDVDQDPLRKRGSPMPRASRKTAPKSLYSVHPGVAMVQKWIEELPQKTGRSLEEWVRLVREKGPATEKERRQ